MIRLLIQSFVRWAFLIIGIGIMIEVWGTNNISLGLFGLIVLFIREVLIIMWGGEDD